MAALHGLLNIDKPPGVTSRSVVNQIQQLVRPAKIGHAGTLDPLATGVLVLGIGAATRLLQYVQRMPKQYRATFLLGRSSPTEDVEGDVTLQTDAPRPSAEAIRSAARELTGTLLQRPPAYSALKVRGRRAYDLARRGERVELEPRRVNVYRIEVVRYEYPELELRIDCGHGTYVRSLGRDLAERLGTQAVMSALVRTAVGCFQLEEAIAPDRLDRASIEAHLRPLRSAVEALPTVRLSDAEVAAIRNGRTIRRAELSGEEPVAAVDAAGTLVAILKRRGAEHWGPACNLPSA